MLLYLRRWSKQHTETTGFFTKTTRVTHTTFFVRARLELTPQEHEMYKVSAAQTKAAVIYKNMEAEEDNVPMWDLVEKPYVDIEVRNIERAIIAQRDYIETALAFKQLFERTLGSCACEIVEEA
jgi:hypothetical protein